MALKFLRRRDGFEGLRKIAAEKPDLVLFDLSMPAMSGFEVLQALRTDSAYKAFLHIPILVTSGVYNPAEIELVRDYGASGFLNKESVQDLLVYRVRKLLASKPQGGADVPSAKRTAGISHCFVTLWLIFCLSPKPITTKVPELESSLT